MKPDSLSALLAAVGAHASNVSKEKRTGVLFTTFQKQNE